MKFHDHIIETSTSIWRWCLVLGLALVLSVLGGVLAPAPVTQAQAPDTKVYLPLIMKGTAACPAGSTQWLCMLNQFRAAAGVPAVAHNSTQSNHLALHTNYMLLNPTQSNFHEEYSDKSGYTENGRNAGMASNMARGFPPNFSASEAMELWMAALVNLSANHRYHMLNPFLTQSGFNFSCNSSNCFSGLNVRGSVIYNDEHIQVTYPGEGQQGVPAIAADNHGFPITWGVYRKWWDDMGDADEIRSVQARVYNQQNHSIAIQVVETSHSNGVYEYINQITVVPTQPLLSKHTYRVEMTVRYLNQNYTRSWSFTTR